MTAQLPTVGGSTDVWGTDLNDFLQVAHDTDGTLLELITASRAAGDELYYHSGDDKFKNRPGRVFNLNDYSGVDATGSSDMSTVISNALAALIAAGVSEVYCPPNSIYLCDGTVVVPARMHLFGSKTNPHWANADERAVFKAANDSVTIMELEGRYTVVEGLYFNLNSKASAVGIRPNNHAQHILNCTFGYGAATATGIKGGGILFLHIADCIWSDSFAGRGVDLLDAYADNPGLVYYGNNVGVIERCIPGAAAGGIRVEGIMVIRDCDFEATYTGYALEMSSASANGYMAALGNYFEMLGTVCIAIHAGNGLSVRIRDNDIYGANASVSGSAGVEFGSICYGGVVEGNFFNRVETGVKNIPPVSATDGGLTVLGNSYANVTDPVSWSASNPTAIAAVNAAGKLRLVHDPDMGLVTVGIATIQSVITYVDGYGSEIDLTKGNCFYLNYTGSTTITVTGAARGMRFTLHDKNGNVTLTNATFNITEGTNTVMGANELRDFVVDYAGAIRQV